jgi:hypothetical protein
LDSKQDFIQKTLERLWTSKKPYNNKTENRLYLSHVKPLKWVLEQSNDNNNNLDKLKRIILIKIYQLKKEKKKAQLKVEVWKYSKEEETIDYILFIIRELTGRLL